MHRRVRGGLGGLLLVAGVGAGVAAVVMGALDVPAQRDVRWALVGLAGGIFGVSLFLAGLLFGRDLRGNGGQPEPTESRRSVVSPEEAKFWLQRFLEEHQKGQTG